MIRTEDWQNMDSLSKTISHALRHHPEEYGPILDTEGWTLVEDIWLADTIPPEFILDRRTKME